MTTETRTPATARAARRPSALLVGTLPVYVAFMLVAHTQMPEDSAADVTPAQLADMEVGWALMHFLWAAPVVLGCLGLWALAGSTTGAAAATRALSLAGIGAMAGFYVVELTLLGSHANPLGDSPLYALGYALSLMATWAAAIATILLCRTLVARRIAVRTAWSVLVLSALYLIGDLLAYLPVLVGSETFADTTAGVPPFLLGIFWAALGARLLRRAPATA